MALYFCAEASDQETDCENITRVSVFQRLETGKANHVAFINYRSSLSDYFAAEIIYSEGKLSFETVMDALPWRHSDFFLDEKERRKAELVVYSEGIMFRHVLVHNSCYYQIRKIQDHVMLCNRITVYEWEPFCNKDMLCYSPLAVLTVPLERREKWKYDCRISRNLPPELCMAILSLPFTMTWG